ncbi:MAG: relaxase/mobilization nuclease domain-containing protein [Clostridium sp.]|jgi:hypothetical protein|nr:relaxase/mobilization nuclease domain-containing protein [Clostridium sp.]
MATTRLIALHVGKGGSIASALGRSTDYVKNPDKTNGGEWVTAYECDPLTADSEFLFARNQYATITGRDQGKRDVLAYHLRQSFKPGEIDPATANRIGYELAMKLTHGNHAFLCCTHVDKEHIHSHIIFNAISLDCTKKFRNFFRSAFAVRRISDQLCLENGLSIIENPKSSNGKDYGDWLGGEKPLSQRDKLGDMIDTALVGCKDFEGFLTAMSTAGVEVKRGKYLAFKAPGQERFIRCKSIGADYTEDAIRKRISGKRVVVQKQRIPSPPKPERVNLLIDIQARIQEGYGGKGFEHWATIENLKVMSKTLIYLQERGLDDYKLLTAKAEVVSESFRKRSERVKEIEIRLKEITALQKNIGTYRKTRDTYKQYISLPPKKREDFFETHRADITLHQAAKKYFDSTGLIKFPPMDDLKKEYAMLSVEKKKLSSGYRAEREEMIALLMAKQNVDRIFGDDHALDKSRGRDTR